MPEPRNHGGLGIGRHLQVLMTMMMMKRQLKQMGIEDTSEMSWRIDNWQRSEKRRKRGNLGILSVPSKMIRRQRRIGPPGKWRQTVSKPFGLFASAGLLEIRSYTVYDYLFIYSLGGISEHDILQHQSYSIKGIGQ